MKTQANAEMQSEASEGSIVRRDTSRPNLLAFKIRKKVPKGGIQWMPAIVEGAFDAQEEVEMLLIMTNYEGSELGAVFDGDAMSVQSRAFACAATSRPQNNGRQESTTGYLECIRMETQRFRL